MPSARGDTQPFDPAAGRARLLGQLGTIEALAGGPAGPLQARAEAVSAWSAAQHLAHAALAIELCLRNLASLAAGSGLLVRPGGEPVEGALAMLAAGSIPRGAARSPRAVQPPAAVDLAAVRGWIADHRAALEALDPAALEPRGLTIAHQLLGPLDAPQWLRFAVVHTAHHLEIAREVLAAVEALPWLTAEVPAVPAAFKVRPEDFAVDELPLYAPSGEGEHLYLEVEKVGVGTFELIGALARALRVPRSAVGCAGLKDAQGVARQTLSVLGGDARRASELSLPGTRVLSVRRHGNKLRIGHLAGNRFRIRLREVPAERLDDLGRVLAILQRRGVPNWFGEQRFGVRGDGWRTGRALLRGEAAEAAAWICGRPGPEDSGRILRAREVFDQGQYAWAAELWPARNRDQLSICRALAAKPGDPRAALARLDRRMAGFFVSAWQSWIFNRVLARRIGAIDQLVAGDLAWKHANGAVFLVEDPEAEAARAASGEISPTGPLFGHRMTLPSGSVAQEEERVLADAGATREEFDRPGPHQPPGGRRPLRFPLGKPALENGRDERGDFVELRFDLPPGCYATAVLREIGKELLREG